VKTLHFRVVYIKNLTVHNYLNVKNTLLMAHKLETTLAEVVKLIFDCSANGKITCSFLIPVNFTIATSSRYIKKFSGNRALSGMIHFPGKTGTM